MTEILYYGEITYQSKLFKVETGRVTIILLKQIDVITPFLYLRLKQHTFREVKRTVETDPVF